MRRTSLPNTTSSNARSFVAALSRAAASAVASMSSWRISSDMRGAPVFMVRNVVPHRQPSNAPSAVRAAEQVEIDAVGLDTAFAGRAAPAELHGATEPLHHHRDAR